MYISTYIYMHIHEPYNSTRPVAQNSSIFTCTVHTKVYLTSPGPSEIGHNSFISQPILKQLRPVDSSLASESSDIRMSSCLNPYQSKDSCMSHKESIPLRKYTQRIRN